MKGLEREREINGGLIWKRRLDWRIASGEIRSEICLWMGAASLFSLPLVNEGGARPPVMTRNFQKFRTMGSIPFGKNPWIDYVSYHLVGHPVYLQCCTSNQEESMQEGRGGYARSFTCGVVWEQNALFHNGFSKLIIGVIWKFTL